MATERTTGLTYHDLQRMFPDEDNLRRELIDGELIVTPAPGGGHQDVVTELVIALGLYVKEHGGKVYPAPRDVLFSDTSVVEPDVLLVLPENLERAEEPYVRGAPDIVVEVSSPSTRLLELHRKRELYERYGVPEYWYVDREADRIEIYRLEKGAYGHPLLLGRGERLESPLLAGFSVPAAEILGPRKP